MTAWKVAALKLQKSDRDKKKKERGSLLLAQSFHLSASAAHIVESGEQGHIHMQMVPDRLMGTARALTP